MTTGFSIQVPSIGTEYYFFDDDKININKRYIATITNIIPFSQAPENLIYEWSENLLYNPNIFNEMTDVFIQTSIPDYDDDPIYFVRDIHGSFYSIEVTNDWQKGRLDITGECNEALRNGYTSTKWTIS